MTRLKVKRKATLLCPKCKEPLIRVLEIETPGNAVGLYAAKGNVRFTHGVITCGLCGYSYNFHAHEYKFDDEDNLVSIKKGKRIPTL